MIIKTTSEAFTVDTHIQTVQKLEIGYQEVELEGPIFVAVAFGGGFVHWNDECELLTALSFVRLEAGEKARFVANTESFEGEKGKYGLCLTVLK